MKILCLVDNYEQIELDIPHIPRVGDHISHGDVDGNWSGKVERVEWCNRNDEGDYPYEWNVVLWVDLIENDGFFEDAEEEGV